MIEDTFISLEAIATSARSTRGSPGRFFDEPEVNLNFRFISKIAVHIFFIIFFSTTCHHTFSNLAHLFVKEQQQPVSTLTGERAAAALQLNLTRRCSDFCLPVFTTAAAEKGLLSVSQKRSLLKPKASYSLAITS